MRKISTVTNWYFASDQNDLFSKATINPPRLNGRRPHEFCCVEHYPGVWNVTFRYRDSAQTERVEPSALVGA